MGKYNLTTEFKYYVDKEKEYKKIFENIIDRNNHDRVIVPTDVYVGADEVEYVRFSPIFYDGDFISDMQIVRSDYNQIIGITSLHRSEEPTWDSDETSETYKYMILRLDTMFDTFTREEYVVTERDTITESYEGLVYERKDCRFRYAGTSLSNTGTVSMVKDNSHHTDLEDRYLSAYEIFSNSILPYYIESLKNPSTMGD